MFLPNLTSQPQLENIKPNVCRVGDTVKILQNAKECGDFNSWLDEKKDMIGKEYRIIEVIDNRNGVSYSFRVNPELNYILPHYCVQKIQHPKTVNINGKEYFSTSKLQAMIQELKEVKPE